MSQQSPPFRPSQINPPNQPQYSNSPPLPYMTQNSKETNKERVKDNSMGNGQSNPPSSLPLSNQKNVLTKSNILSTPQLRDEKEFPFSVNHGGNYAGNQIQPQMSMKKGPSALTGSLQLNSKEVECKSGEQVKTPPNLPGIIINPNSKFLNSVLQKVAKHNPLPRSSVNNSASTYQSQKQIQQGKNLGRPHNFSTYFQSNAENRNKAKGTTTTPFRMPRMSETIFDAQTTASFDLKFNECDSPPIVKTHQNTKEHTKTEQFIKDYHFIKHKKQIEIDSSPAGIIKTPLVQSPSVKNVQIPNPMFGIVNKITLRNQQPTARLSIVEHPSYSQSSGQSPRYQLKQSNSIQTMSQASIQSYNSAEHHFGSLAQQYEFETDHHFQSSKQFSPPAPKETPQSAFHGFSHFATSPPRQKKVFTVKDFVRIKELGTGKYGQVYLAREKASGFICALKILQKKLLIEEQITQQLIRELKIQMFLNHSNIIKMYGYFDDAEFVYIILEVGTGGQLYHLLRSSTLMSQEKAVFVLRQVCDAIKQIHTYKIIHRDIKPENIVMHDGVVKLCDFGWSVYQNLQIRKTFCGTPLYVCPQILKGRSYNEKIDVWSLGIMLYEMLVGENPFKITHENELIRIVRDQVEIPSYAVVSLQARDFLDKCLQKNPDCRASIKELIHHNIFLKYKDKREKKDKNIDM